VGRGGDGKRHAREVVRSLEQENVRVNPRFQFYNRADFLVEALACSFSLVIPACGARRRR